MNREIGAYPSTPRILAILPFFIAALMSSDPRANWKVYRIRVYSVKKIVRMVVATYLWIFGNQFHRYINLLKSIAKDNIHSNQKMRKVGNKNTGHAMSHPRTLRLRLQVSHKEYKPTCTGQVRWWTLYQCTSWFIRLPEETSDLSFPQPWNIDMRRQPRIHIKGRSIIAVGVARDERSICIIIALIRQGETI